MQNWLPALAGDGSKYSTIADAIAGAIRSGELRPGERLPSQRALAARLGVDLTTVTRAYGLVRQAGLVEGAGKLGSFVRNDALPPVLGESASEAGMNVPPQPGFGLLADEFASGTARLLRAGRHSPILQYQPSAGNLLDRRQAAETLTARGIPTQAEQVVITAGAQNALHAIMQRRMRAGEGLCCGRFVYPGLLALAASAGVRIWPVAADAEGLLPKALEERLRRGVRTVYVTPTNDNPTTATMSLGRRQAIAEVTRRYAAMLIEDDAYGVLPSHPLPPVASLAPECTWYIAGTSKVLSPVLRVAFVRVPTASDASVLSSDVHRTAIMAPPLNAALVTLWQKSGAFERLVAGIRAEAVARQRIAARCLVGLNYETHAQGYHLWLDVACSDPVSVSQAISAMGLSIVPASTFAASPECVSHHVRISIGGAIDHPRLERALRRTREIVCEGRT